MNYNAIWNNFLKEIKDELSSLAFETWFNDTKLYKIENSKAFIIVPMPIHKKHLSDNYLDKIVTILSKIAGGMLDVEFYLDDEIEILKKKEVDSSIENIPSKTLNSKKISNLNEKYTFENFIVGNSNKFAHAAALSVAENPGKMYNPLFIYGNSGLGKTHLMHAIGNYIMDITNKHVLYVTSDQFIQDFIGINKKDSSGTNFNHVDFFKNK